MGGVERVVILGRGGAGKSTAALRLGRLTGLPVIELDKHFWRPGLVATPPEAWSEIQLRLAAANCWIMDGDLGPYDALAARLSRADTVLVLDFSLVRCAWRVLRRSRERTDFWWWLLTWRYRSRAAVVHAATSIAVDADVYIVRTPHQLGLFLASVNR